MARQSKDSASDLNANIVIRPSIGAFDGLEEDDGIKTKKRPALFGKFAFNGLSNRVMPDIEEEEDNDSPPPRLSFRPSSNGLREGAKNGKQRIQRLDGLRNIQGLGFPPMKSRKLSPEDSPSPLLYKPSQRARRDLSDSDQEADLDASDKDFVTNKKNLGRLQRGVKPQTKKKAKKEGKSPWVIAGNEESSESEDKEIVIQDSPEPIEVKPAMRVNIHANKDYGPKMVNLEEVGQELKEDATDEILQNCHEISDRLKNALRGKNSVEALEGGDRMADIELLKKACGENAKYCKSYQLIGINFLLLLVREGVEGSILADEMGLGKTAQAILFLGCLRELYKDPGPHIIVCPASLLENWQREFQRWCPSLEVVAYYGPERSELRRTLESLRNNEGVANIEENNGTLENGDVQKLDDSESEDSASEDGSEFGEDGDVADRPKSHAKASSGSAPFNVLLTCYNLFERDSLEQRLDRNFLKRWNWSHIILDEAHAVKNSNAQRTRRLNLLAERCRRRIMLTGTPLQNDLEELQNLLRFLMPKLFTAEQAEELEKVQDEGDLDRLAERMKNLLKPFVLRRLKTEVANQLAPKQHKLFCIEMTPSQSQTYQDAVAQFKKDIGNSLPSETDQDAQKKEAAKAIKKLSQKKLGNAFVALRKIALHPLLTRRVVSEERLTEFAKLARRRGIFGGDATLERVKEELDTYSDFQLHLLAEENGSAFSSFLLNDTHLYSSAKCRMLAKILPELKAAGSRPLIFSQWTMVLDILEWLLQTLGLPYCRLDGSTAVADRLTIVDLFNNEENGVFAFLLSSRAGGQGLNLTGADTVILHDVDFNPQIDRQAEDRCHRLGQTKPVTVIRMVTENSVDAGIHALAEKKLKLDAAVLDGLAASSKQTKIAENAGMTEILQSLLTGEELEKDKSESEPSTSIRGITEHFKDLPDPSGQNQQQTPVDKKQYDRTAKIEEKEVISDSAEEEKEDQPLTTPKSSLKSEQTNSPEFRIMNTEKKKKRGRPPKIKADGEPKPKKGSKDSEKKSRKTEEIPKKMKKEENSVVVLSPSVEERKAPKNSIEKTPQSKVVSKKSGKTEKKSSKASANKSVSKLEKKE